VGILLHDLCPAFLYCSPFVENDVRNGRVVDTDAGNDGDMLIGGWDSDGFGAEK